MPPFQPDLPPPCGNTPPNNVDIWHHLREFFEDQLKDILVVRQTEGDERAEQEHEKKLQSVKDWETWDDMFLQGCLRNPRATEVIEEARAAFHRFRAPLKTPDEERLCKLRYMKHRMQGILRRAQTKLPKDIEKHAADETEVYLKEAFIEAESYQDLVHKNEEARHLVQDIIGIIGDLAALVKSKQK